MSGSVAGAWSRYQQGDADGALEELLAVWEGTRNPELAGLIEAVIASQPREPLRGPTRARLRREWQAMVADASPLDVPRLLDALTTFLCRDATELLAEFLELPPNPLVSSRLLQLILEPPNNYEGQTQVPFWDLLVRVMSHCADPRSREPLAGVVGRYDKLAAKSHRPYGGLSAVQAHLLPRLTQLLGSLDALETDLSDEELAACRRFDGHLASATRSESAADRVDVLLRQVYAEPGDDTVRMVLADAMIEAEDPRGELIVIQMRQAHGEKLSREMRRRQRELLSMYGRIWLGPMEPALQKSGLVYRRGFPAQGRATSYRVADIETVLASPEWTTFEALDVSRVAKPGALILRPDMTELRRVWGMSADVFETEHVLPFEVLSLRRRGLPAGKHLAQCRTLPRLRELDIHAVNGRDTVDPAALRPLWFEGALGHQLDTLTTCGLGAWIAACRQHPPPVRRLNMTPALPSFWGGTLSRDETGRLSHLTLHSSGLRVPVAELRAELAGGWDCVRTVEVRLPQRLPARERDAIEQLLRRGKNVESVELTEGEKGPS